MACGGGGQELAFPGSCVRRGSGHRGLRRRLGDGAERRKRPKRRNRAGHRKRAGRRSGRGGRGGRGTRLGIPGERADDRFRQPVRRRLEGAHLGEQAVGGGPLAGVLGQAALDQPPYFGRHLVKAGGAVDHAVQQRGRGPGAERALARGGEGEDRPEAEYVARRPDFKAGRLLGGHEPGRADHQARLRQRGRFRRPGDAEINDPRSILGQQHIRRLKVPVHHARGVDRAQALGQASGQRQQRARRQRPVVIYRLEQRRPRNVSRSQPRHRAVDIRVHHHGREQTAHPPRRGDLPAEPHPEIRILGQLSADDLDRDRPAARGDAEVHPPHATAAKATHQPVGTDRRRIPRLQSLDHAGPPTSSPKTPYGISDRTTIITARAN
jgi:hypothetical protein